LNVEISQETYDRVMSYDRGVNELVGNVYGRVRDETFEEILIGFMDAIDSEF